MLKLVLSSAILVLPLVVSGCDRGPYDPSAHRHADASTGTMLSGNDTGANLDSDTNNPSTRSNYHTGGGK